MERHSFVNLPKSTNEDGTCTPASQARTIFMEAVHLKQVIKIPQSLLWAWGWDCLKETSPEFEINLNNRAN